MRDISWLRRLKILLSKFSIGICNFQVQKIPNWQPFLDNRWKKVVRLLVRQGRYLYGGPTWDTNLQTISQRWLNYFELPGQNLIMFNMMASWKITNDSLVWFPRKGMLFWCSKMKWFERYPYVNYAFKKNFF